MYSLVILYICSGSNHAVDTAATAHINSLYDMIRPTYPHSSYEIYNMFAASEPLV
jgi:hypothetical protein